MSAIAFLIEQLAFGLYIFIGVGALLAMLSLRRAQRDWRQTHYELERELARFRQSNAWTALILLAEGALIIFGVQQVVAPLLRRELDAADLAAAQQVIEDGTFIPPVITAPAVGFQPDVSGVEINPQILVEQVLATPTLTPTPVGTLLPNPPAVVGCDTENAQLFIPANGMVVFEPTTVRGVAFVEDFAFYRLEIRGGQLSNFAVLSQVTTPVTEAGELGQFVPSVFDNGEYQFRLTVFDITSTVRASCMITINLSDPPPTATPLGTLAPIATVAGAGN